MRRRVIQRTPGAVPGPAFLHHVLRRLVRESFLTVVEVVVHAAAAAVGELLLDRDRRRREDARLAVVDAFAIVAADIATRVKVSGAHSALVFTAATSTVVALQVEILLAVFRHPLERRQGEVAVVSRGAAAR